MLTPVSYAPPVMPSSASSAMPLPPPQSRPSARRPLAKIRFDRPNVNFEQPVYNAVSNALQKYPGARIEIVAVHPSHGNAAQVAIESTRSRRNAERVMRSLTQMGVDLAHVDLSYSSDPQARTNEVHVFIR